MPLIQSSSPAAVSQNIREMRAAGHPQAQAVAAALNVARQHRDMGGAAPWYERQEARGEDAGTRFIASAGPGRTDIHNADVASGSYILPADVVSGLGEGNSLAGARLTQEMLSSGPWGTPLPQMRGRSTIPAPPRPMTAPGTTATRQSPAFAKGGAAHQGHEKVPVILAGGEIQIPPFVVAHHHMLGGLPLTDRDPKRYEAALAHGHAVLDAFVKETRARTVKELKALPGPKK